MEKTQILLNLKIDNNINSYQFLNNDDFKKLLFNEVVNRIKISINRGFKTAKLVSINNSFILEIKREDFKTSLKNSLKFFEKCENYELCSEIVKLINSI